MKKTIVKMQDLTTQHIESSTNTQAIVSWLDHIYRVYYDELRDRCQETIYIHFYCQDDLEELGNVIWDDLTDSDRLVSLISPPNIDPALVDWKRIANFTCDRLKLKLMEDADWEDWEE